MRDTDRIDKIVFHIVPLAFYLFFAFFDRAVICADTPSYINMDLSREPIYPMLLSIFRCVFGLNYLLVVVIFQSVLAAFSATYIGIQFSKMFKLRCLESYMVMLMPLLVSALCRFIAKRASMYSNTILTEGITCSLFLIFFVLLVKYSIESKIYDLVWIIIVLVLMISTRKQMYFCLILFSVYYICRTIYMKRKRIRNLLALVLFIIIVIVSNKEIERGYNILLNGQMIEHFNSNRFLATMVFYVADESDAYYIENESTRMLFKTIYYQCDAEDSVLHSAPKGLFNRLKHFGDHYDMIQIDHMWPEIEKYAASVSKLDDSVSREMVSDDIMSQIIKGILPHRIPELVSVFLVSCIDGMINTVAKVNPILSIYALLFWVLYLLILIIRGKRTGFDDISKLGLLAIGSTIINIGVVASQIFCQTRYMIYNMPIIYIAILLMMRKKNDTVY